MLVKEITVSSNEFEKQRIIHSMRGEGKKWTNVFYFDFESPFIFGLALNCFMYSNFLLALYDNT